MAASKVILKSSRLERKLKILEERASIKNNSFDALFSPIDDHDAFAALVLKKFERCFSKAAELLRQGRTLESIKSEFAKKSNLVVVTAPLREMPSNLHSARNELIKAIETINESPYSSYNVSLYSIDDPKLAFRVGNLSVESNVILWNADNPGQGNMLARFQDRFPEIKADQIEFVDHHANQEILYKGIADRLLKPNRGLLSINLETDWIAACVGLLQESSVENSLRFLKDVHRELFNYSQKLVSEAVATDAYTGHLRALPVTEQSNELFFDFTSSEALMNFIKSVQDSPSLREIFQWELPLGSSAEEFGKTVVDYLITSANRVFEEAQQNLRQVLRQFIPNSQEFKLTGDFMQKLILHSPGAALLFLETTHQGAFLNQFNKDFWELMHKTQTPNALHQAVNMSFPSHTISLKFPDENNFSRTQLVFLDERNSHMVRALKSALSAGLICPVEVRRILGEVVESACARLSTEAVEKGKRLQKSLRDDSDDRRKARTVMEKNVPAAQGISKILQASPSGIAPFSALQHSLDSPIRLIIGIVRLDETFVVSVRKVAPDKDSEEHSDQTLDLGKLAEVTYQVIGGNRDQGAGTIPVKSEQMVTIESLLKKNGLYNNEMLPEEKIRAFFLQVINQSYRISVLDSRQRLPVFQIPFTRIVGRNFTSREQPIRE